jgi:hypothetical protein
MTLLFGKKRVMVPENGFIFWKDKSYGSCEWLPNLWRRKEKETKKNIMKWSE